MLTLHTNYKFLIICAYFPNDPGTVIYYNAKLGIVLADIADTLLKSIVIVLLAGDINCDFTLTTGFVDNIKQFYEKYRFDLTME